MTGIQAIRLSIYTLRTLRSDESAGYIALVRTSDRNPDLSVRNMHGDDLRSADIDIWTVTTIASCSGVLWTAEASPSATIWVRGTSPLATSVPNATRGGPSDNRPTNKTSLKRQNIRQTFLAAFMR